MEFREPLNFLSLYLNFWQVTENIFITYLRLYQGDNRVT
jgi:hypothetical protein